VLGQLAQTYIIAEGPEGMYLIDQHAAHERVMYEELLAQQAEASVPVQGLLEPLAIELTPGQAEELEAWLEPLRKLGFEVEPFGGHTVLVRSVPAILARADVRQMLSGILDELALDSDPLSEQTDARLAAAACKRGATKAGQTLSVAEMQALISQLERAASPRTCPHGRPIMILLSQTWMEREFGRR
jgi:DNA mismatch repair protein MutL